MLFLLQALISCLIIEAYLELLYTPAQSLYSAQLLTVPVYTAFNSPPTEATVTTKHIRNFAFAFEIIEACINHLYSAQLIALPVYTAFNSSRTKENITTKRSFALVFECRRSSRRTKNYRSFALSQ